ncbi:hypothetical protein [Bacillus sp. T33-2]|uniref:hypothetical protein n=1 Tax=Bacillus sp. T33-2 TaxID=2054168 RepID=UPI000C776496|nr:hypothetical protein [Bacillus sp. T33-2]PLR99678.1 hypothetical protein CVD19_01045 [Bacillus sp. T33-2]
MYRFSIGNGNWIIKFSPHLTLGAEEKEAIVNSLLHLGSHWTGYSHSDSFVIFHESTGMIVFRVEEIPSLILTVTTIVPKDKWYVKTDAGIRKYN